MADTHHAEFDAPNATQRRPMTQTTNNSQATDSPLRRLLRNAGYLLGSRVLRDGMGLLSLALVARHLGPGGFGVIALLQSYTFTINWLVNFQTWQAIVRYGAGMDDPSRRGELRGLLRLALLLDAATALLGGLLGVVLAGWAGELWGWDETTVRLARWYCLLTIVPDWTGTWTGILRLFDRFGLMCAQGVIASIVKLSGAIIGVTSDWVVTDFIWLWMAAEASGLLLAAVFSAWVSAAQQMITGEAPGCRQVLKQHPGLLRFFVTTNWHATVRMASKEADTLIIGAMMGSAGAGLFKIVKQIASVLSRAADPLYQAVYPELARLWTEGDRDGFRHILRRSTAIGLAVGVGYLGLFWLAGEWVLVTLLGGDYALAYEPTLIYLVAVGLSAASFAFHPAALAMDRPTDSLTVLVSATVVYFALLVPAVLWQGLQGAAAAYILFYVIWVCAIGVRLRRWIRENP